MRIRPTKFDSPHWQWVLPEFVERLKEKKKEIEEEYPDCPWVCHFRGKEIKSWKRGFATAKRRAGITRRIRPYDLRHYHITHALANGADIYDLARRMGHKNPQMIVKVYSHLAKDVVKRKAHPLPSLYDRPKKRDDQEVDQAPEGSKKSPDQAPEDQKNDKRLDREVRQSHKKGVSKKR